MWKRFAKLVGPVGDMYAGKRLMIGRDAAGNTYWEAAATSVGGRTRRSVDMKEQTLEDVTEFSHQHIPVEWSSWLNHRRPNAPTPDEIAASDARRQQIQVKVQQLQNKSASQQLEIQESNQQLLAAVQAQYHDQSPAPLPAEHKPYSHEKEVSSEPIGRGESFQPGQWKPSRRER